MRTIPLSKLSSFARLCAVSLAVVVTLGACSDDDDVTDDLPPRFDELDLSSPEAAVATFAAAFEQRDYLTAFRALSVESQEVVATLPSWFFGGSGVGFRYDWLDTQYRMSAADDLGDWVVGRHIDDWILPSELQGEQVLRALAAHGALPVDVTNGLSGLHVLRADETDAVVLAVTDVDDETSVVRISLAADRDGRWRLHQLLAPGGDDEVFPFAGPTDGPPSAATEDEWISTAERLRPDDPDLAIARTIAFFDERDWRMFVGSFHPSTARSALQAISSFELEGRFLTLDTPDYTEAWRVMVDDGPVVYGYMTSLAYEHGDATGSLLVDLAGGKAAPAVRVDDWSGDEAWAAEVVVDDVTYVVTVARGDSPPGFAFAQIRTPDGSTDTAAAPFSSPAQGFAIPGGAELCPDGIVRWNCRDSAPQQLTPEDEARIEELRREADADPSLEVQNQVIIQSILSSARGVANIDAYCAAMQLGSVPEGSIDGNLDAIEVAELAESYCPGDPSVIPTG